MPASRDHQAGDDLRQQFAAEIKASLGELVADARALLDWEKSAGAWGVPRTPQAKRTLAPLRPPSSGDSPDSPSGPPSPAGEPATATDLESLRHILGACRRCDLAHQRTKIVFGEGPAQARLLVIGEGPGYREDRSGRPFVGPAGELLTRILKAIGLARDEVYICNIVKCRPPQNRDPRPPEMAACVPFVQRQIELVKPEVIVALGKVATQALLNTTKPLGSLRGRFHDYHGTPIMPTYHPAALLRDAKLKRPVWEDMQQVQKRLNTSPP